MIAFRASFTGILRTQVMNAGLNVFFFKHSFINLQKNRQKTRREWEQGMWLLFHRDHFNSDFFGCCCNFVWRSTLTCIYWLLRHDFGCGLTFEIERPLTDCVVHLLGTLEFSCKLNYFRKGTFILSVDVFFSLFLRYFESNSRCTIRSTDLRIKLDDNIMSVIFKHLFTGAFTQALSSCLDVLLNYCWDSPVSGKSKRSRNGNRNHFFASI